MIHTSIGKIWRQVAGQFHLVRHTRVYKGKPSDETNRSHLRNFLKTQNLNRKPAIKYRKGISNRLAFHYLLHGFSGPSKSGDVVGFNLNGGYVPSYAQWPRRGKKLYVPIGNWQWYAGTKDQSAGGAVRQSGGGIGRLDAANEDGFFFRLNKSRLKKLKQLLKDDKGELKGKETPPEKKSGG